MQVKQLCLITKVVQNPDGSQSIAPVDFNEYGALLPFWIPCQVYCHLALDKDSPRKLETEIRILGPDGRDCGFMRDETHSSTFYPLRCSFDLSPEKKEAALLIPTLGPTFNQYGPHSIVLMVNGSLLATIPFNINNPSSAHSTSGQQ